MQVLFSDDLMLDGKRYVLLGIFLLLVVGGIGTISLFGVEGSGITGATSVEIGTIESCMDSDLGSTFSIGEVTEIYSSGTTKIYRDSCESASILLEYSCDIDGVISERIICGTECFEGACV